MKKTLFFLLCFASVFSLEAKKSELDSLFAVLDDVLENSYIYVEKREQKIADYKHMFDVPNLTPEQKYDINLKLYDTYYSFKPDSAIVYMQQNILIAEKLNNKMWLAESKLRLCSSYVLKGRAIDALELIQSIPRSDLKNNDILKRYYSTYNFLYDYYTQDEEKREQINLRRDSIRMITDKNTTSYLDEIATKLFSEGKCAEAREIFFSLYKDIKVDTHSQAMAAFSIGNTYRCEGNMEMQKKYYTIAAIADARNGIKENAALRLLAIICYETNDIDRAYRYIYRSMEDATFANVNFRLIEVSQIFPIIEKSYLQKVQKQQNRLYFLLLCIGLLSFLLIIAIIYVSVQIKRLRRTRRALSEANEQLSELNENLKKSNEEKTEAYDKITQVNKELSEANKLKETYISEFLTICSMYIRKLDNYQKTLNKKAFENRTSELFKMLKSRDMIENELKELYNLFDSIFLDLYPDFVQKFNELLPESEQIHPKQNELLNTELRIFALIRLGITDSSKIADFLHYSLTTIYNYRTRIRNKAIVPSEDFENIVMKIGVI